MRETASTDPLAAAVVEPFGRVVRFVSVDPAERRFRFSELRLQPALWGGGALVRAWGRLGPTGRWRAPAYPAAAAAQEALALYRDLGRRAEATNVSVTLAGLALDAVAVVRERVPAGAGPGSRPARAGRAPPGRGDDLVQPAAGVPQPGLPGDGRAPRHSG